MERQRRLRGAAVVGDLPRVRRILQQPGGVNVKAATRGGFTVLHLAVYRGHLAIVHAILQVDGVNVNARSHHRFQTPLHCACSADEMLADRIENPLPIIQALLDAGADPNAADFDGYTPLFYYIIDLCPISTVEALLAEGANPAARNRYLDTPLHTACRYGRLETVQLLIQRQGSECLTFKNNREETPLDRLSIGQDHYNTPGGDSNSIRQHILQSCARMIAQRDGLLCLHSILHDAAFTDVADDGDDEEFELPVGTLNRSTCRSFWNISLLPNQTQCAPWTVMV